MGILDAVKSEGIRELYPEDFWSGSIRLPGGTSTEDFSRFLESASKTINFTFSGYISGGEDAKTYTFTRYPRRAFGPIPDEEVYSDNLRALSLLVGTESTEEELSDTPRFRVVLGLNDGYAEARRLQILKDIDEQRITTKEQVSKLWSDLLADEANGHPSHAILFTDSLQAAREFITRQQFGRVHTPEEVSAELGSGLKFSVKPAEILTVSPDGQKYQELAVIIEGNSENLDKVYQLASRFHQERFCVEDLHEGASFMVETKWCQTPDPDYSRMPGPTSTDS